MKIFIDSTNISEITECVNFMPINGITTNPILVAKSELTNEQIAANICNIDTVKKLKMPVNIQIIDSSEEGIIESSKKIHKISPENIIIKLPITVNGIKACKFLKEIGIKVNITACFSVEQVIIAARAGATFISVFMGKSEDSGENSNKLINEVMHVMRTYNFQSEIIAASIRNKLMFKTAALAGTHIATATYEIISSICQNNLTDQCIYDFINASKNKKNIE